MSSDLASDTCICAWCDCELGFQAGKVQGVSATNYGMCRDCLAKRLAAAIGLPHRLSPDLASLAVGRRRRRV